MGRLELLLLGTGTSSGVPVIGCHCAVCSSSDPKDKRLRTSAVVSYGDTHVLIDTTPDMRTQCLTHGVDKIDAVVFTHGHADHIMGLDDVRGFNVVKMDMLDAWADSATFEVLHRCFGYAFVAQWTTHPLWRPRLRYRPIEGPFAVGGVTWTPVPLKHGQAANLGFRIGALAYCTDVSVIPPESYGLLRGLDVLVLDSLRQEPHPAHLSIAQAVEAARRIGAKETWLVHMSHDVAHAKTDAELPEHVHLAYDGVRLTADC